MIATSDRPGNNYWLNEIDFTETVIMAKQSKPTDEGTVRSSM